MKVTTQAPPAPPVEVVITLTEAEATALATALLSIPFGSRPVPRLSGAIRNALRSAGKDTDW